MSEQHDKRMIRVRDLWTIRLHWFNAAAWGLLVVSGLGIISGAELRLAPAFWPTLMQNLFGGNTVLIPSHVAIGILWVLGIGLFTVVRWRTVAWPFLRDVMTLMPRGIIADLHFMIVVLARLFGLMKATPLPPQGHYNGAQRLLGTMIVFASVAIALTGMYLFLAPKVIAFGDAPLAGALFRWALVIHAAAVFLVLIGLIAHIYFAVIEERDALEGMKTGYASADFIEHHSPLWYEQLKRDGKV